MPIRVRRLRFVIASLVAASLVASCASPPTAPMPGFAAPRPADTLEVRLVFGEAADLDLFVSDPRQEALYFGNNPSLGGGRLDVDRRCEAAAPRVEIARFLGASPGRYRVGVSYDRACGFRREPVPYEILVEADGLSLSRQGVVEPGEFEHIALEFDLPPPADSEAGDASSP